MRAAALTAATLSLAAIGVIGCGTEPKAQFAAIEVPACRDVSRFGNAASCDDGPGITACGAGKAGLCASGWLCFDAPELAFCACAVDEDCAGRSAYINAARAARKRAPLADRCVNGRCQGAP